MDLQVNILLFGRQLIWMNQSAEHKVMDNPNFSQKIFSSLSLYFISMYLIIVGLSRTLLMLSRPRAWHISTRLLYSLTLQHKAFILKELDSMYPDAFRTELSDSPTALRASWRKQVLEVVPWPSPWLCKFEAKTAHAPDGADGTCAAEEGHRRRPRPPRRKPLRLPARALRRRRFPKAKGAKDPRAEGQTGPSVK